jgi:hypothetical protein
MKSEDVGGSSAALVLEAEIRQTSQKAAPLHDGQESCSTRQHDAASSS